jgi:putative dimethyl sulfoxide reductase chaperone
MKVSKIVDRQQEWAEFLAAEWLTLGLLGKLLFVYPDREWIQSLIDEDVFSDIPLDVTHPHISRGFELVRNWCATNRRGLTKAGFRELQLDYTRLFIGIDSVLAPPWESVHLSREHLLFQEQTVQVRHWYLRYGLQVIQKDKEPDDHIGLEMTFLAHLAGQALVALQEVQSEERFDALLTAQRHFLAQHPLCWVSQWSAQVTRNAATDFYRGIGWLTHGLLLAIALRLDAEIPVRHAIPGFQ